MKPLERAEEALSTAAAAVEEAGGLAAGAANLRLYTDVLDDVRHEVLRLGRRVGALRRQLNIAASNPAPTAKPRRGARRR